VTNNGDQLTQRRSVSSWWRHGLPSLGFTAGLGLIATAGIGSAINPPATPQLGTLPEIHAAADPASQPGLQLGTAVQLGPMDGAGEIPRRLALPSLRVDAPIVPVGVLPDGTLAVPPNPQVLGWWQGGARVANGQGSIVIDGHVDTATDGSGALFRLRELRPGDPLLLRTDHRSQRYVIAALRSYPKAGLPAEVFAASRQPRLVIITCGGAFNTKTRQYADNIVVYAVPS
jgi:hypothetical protein